MVISRRAIKKALLEMPLYVWSELIIVFFWFLLVPQGIGVTHWLSTSQDLTAIHFNRQKGLATNKILKSVVRFDEFLSNVPTN